MGFGFEFCGSNKEIQYFMDITSALREVFGVAKNLDGETCKVS